MKTGVAFCIGTKMSCIWHQQIYRTLVIADTVQFLLSEFLVMTFFKSRAL